MGVGPAIRRASIHHQSGIGHNLGTQAATIFVGLLGIVRSCRRFVFVLIVARVC